MFTYIEAALIDDDKILNEKTGTTANDPGKKDNVFTKILDCLIRIEKKLDDNTTAIQAIPCVKFFY